MILSGLLWLAEERVTYNQFLGELQLGSSFSQCLGAASSSRPHHHGLVLGNFTQFTCCFARFVWHPGSPLTLTEKQMSVFEQSEASRPPHHSEVLSRILMPSQDDQYGLPGKKHDSTSYILSADFLFQNVLFAQVSGPVVCGRGFTKG